MTSAMAIKPLSFNDEQRAELLVQDILKDAVVRRQLFPSAQIVRGLSRHQHKHQWQFTVQTQGGAFFIKAQELRYLPRFAAEQHSLLSILATQTLSVGAPLASGSVQRTGEAPMSYLILQHIPLAVHGDWFSAGQQLAQLHSHVSERGYGFERMTWCGELAQDNRWNDNWADFYLNQRLRPILSHCAEHRIHFPTADTALQYAANILSQHQPAASLLHGDLWSGNIGFNPDRQLSYPVLFDPASYYGDAEADLAMTELFGRFPQRFYEGYQSVAALSDGYEERRPVYQLYHVLGHALQFGGSYVQQASNLMAQMKP